MLNLILLYLKTVIMSGLLHCGPDDLFFLVSVSDSSLTAYTALWRINLFVNKYARVTAASGSVARVTSL